MKNFIFKSTDADLQKMFQSIETTQKNVLYMTHRVDAIIKAIRSLQTDIGIQKQVDEFYEHPPEVTPEEEDGNRTSN